MNTLITLIAPLRSDVCGHMAVDTRIHAYKVGATNKAPYKLNRKHLPQSIVSASIVLNNKEGR